MYRRQRPHDPAFGIAHCRSLLVVVVSCLGVLMVAHPCRAGDATISVADGLSLRFDDQGRVTACRIGGRDCLLPGARGGFFVADVGSVPAHDVELLTNPGFETVADGKPAGWEVGADWRLDQAVRHTGSRSMKVSIPPGTKRSSGALAVDLSVRPNTPYRVSFWMKTEGCAPSFYLVQKDHNGKTRSAWPQVTISHSRRRSDWFKLETSLTTAPFCEKLRVYVSVWQQTGTAWIDDASVSCLEDDYLTPQTPLTGAVEPAGEGVNLALARKDLGLQLDARVSATDKLLRFRGELRDATGRDRAVALSFRLPLKVSGWTWYDDIHNAQPLDRDLTYGAARLVSDRRLLSLYPFCALGGDAAGLTLALPMDRPCAFRLGYTRRTGLFLNYEFGLTPAAVKFPSRASFSFVLERIDPQWGFRSAAKRYYETFPQFFTKRVKHEGGAGFMADRKRFESPDFIPPAFAIFDYWKRDALPDCRREGVRLFSYTEPAGWWGWAIGITKEQAKTKPSYEQAWAYVEQRAHASPPDRVARCILNCSPFDREGKRLLHKSYVPAWGGYNYVCNPDPEITGLGGRLNRYTLTQERETAKVKTFGLDGMYFDCVFVYSADNFRRSHFPWADHPLAFDHLTKKPVIPLTHSIYECVKAISDDMHKRGKLVMSNYSVTTHPTNLFCIQFIDVIGNEMLWTWATDAKLALQRTLAYQKSVSMSWQEAKNGWSADRLEREVKQAMFYGTFYYLSGLKREIHDRWTPVTRRLAAAGWEPIPDARVAPPDLLLERFGSVPRRDLHFTLRNDGGNPLTATLTLDAQALGLTDMAADIRLVTGACSYSAPLPVQRRGTTWQVRVPAPAHDTVALRVGGPPELALEQVAAATAALQKALRNKKSLAAAGAASGDSADYAAAIRKLAAVQAALRDGAAPAQQSARDLTAVAARLFLSHGKKSAASPGFQQRRLAYHTTQARHAILSAAALLRRAT